MWKKKLKGDLRKDLLMSGVSDWTLILKGISSILLFREKAS